jgi:hypothetical protein
MTTLAIGAAMLPVEAVLTGCIGADVVIAAIGAAAQIAASAANILSPVNPSTANVLGVVAKDLLLIQNLYQQYETAAAGDKPGLASQIQAIITTVTGNLTAILSAVRIANPTLVTYISVGIAVVNSAITIIISHLPPAVKTAALAKRAAGPPLPEVQGAKSSKDLKKAWNDASVANGHPEAVVK